MWAQIKHLQRNGWTEKQIKRPYLAFEAHFADALQHTLPHIIPPSHHEDAVYPLPRVVFRMFDYTDIPDVCDVKPIPSASVCCLSERNSLQIFSPQLSSSFYDHPVWLINHYIV